MSMALRLPMPIYTKYATEYTHTISQQQCVFRRAYWIRWPEQTQRWKSNREKKKPFVKWFYFWWFEKVNSAELSIIRVGNCFVCDFMKQWNRNKWDFCWGNVNALKAFLVDFKCLRFVEGIFFFQEMRLPSRNAIDEKCPVFLHTICNYFIKCPEYQQKKICL